MRHTTARVRVERSVRALFAAVLVMALGTAPAGVAEPTADQSAPDSVSAEQPALDAGLPSVDSGAAEAADGDSGTDAAAPASPSGAATSPAQSSPAATPSGTAPLGPNPLFPGAVTEDGITVKRDGDVDTIHVHDSEGELWQWGWKASEENIFALSRKGEVTEVLSVTADGRELDREKFGWVNTKAGAFIGFDLNALHTIPPVDVTIKVKTKTKGDYDIAESEDIPTSEEFAKTGYDPKEELDPEVEAQLRAAAPEDIKQYPGMQHQKLIVKDLSNKQSAGKQELEFTVGEDPTTNWLLTKFTIGFDCNSRVSSGIGDKFRFRVVRDGRTIVDQTDGGPWESKNRGWEGSPICKRTLFRINMPEAGSYNFEGKQIEFRGGDKIILNFDGPNLTPPRPGGSAYYVDVYGKDITPKKESWNEKFRTEGEGVLVKDLGVEGKNPYKSRGRFLQASNFERAYVRVKAPNSPLAIEKYGLTIDRIEDGVRLEKRVVSTTPEEIIYEVYPVSNETGVRLPSVKVPQDAVIETTASYPSRPKDIESTATVFGTPADGAPLPSISQPKKGELINSSYPNPPMPKKCGLNVAIVADLSVSLSYADADAFGESKKAAKKLVESLQGTPTNVGVFSFADRAKNDTGGAKSVDGDFKVINDAIDSWSKGARGGATNWEAGLNAVKEDKTHYDVVYFITDGMPTSDNSNWQNALDGHRGGKNFGSFVQETSLNRAIVKADELKRNGTRIVPLMVDLKLGPNRDYVVTQDYVLKDIKDFQETKKDNYSYITQAFSRTGTRAHYPRNPNDPTDEGYKTVVNVERALIESDSDNRIFRFGKNLRDGSSGTLPTSGEYVPTPAGSDYLQAGPEEMKALNDLTHGIRTVKSMGEDISGPNDTIRLASYSKLVGEFESLGDSLLRACEGKVIVKKQIVDSNGQVLRRNAKGWEFSISSDKPVIENADGRTGFEDTKLSSTVSEEGPSVGETTSDEATPDDRANVVWPIHSDGGAEVIIAETQQDSFSLYPVKDKNAVCVQKLPGKDSSPAEVSNEGQAGFKVAIPATEDGRLATVTCTVSNEKQKEELVSLHLEKLDFADRTLSLKSAKFEVRETKEGQPVAPVEWSDAASAYKTETRLEPGTEYYLVETQAPVGENGIRYSLLTAPVKFKVVTTEQGPQVWIGREDEWVKELGNAGLWTDVPPNPAEATAYMQVANVRQGNLPKTGGHGLQVPLALSTVLMLFGAALARRRAVQV